MNHTKTNNLLNDFVFVNKIHFINHTNEILNFDLNNATVIMDFYSLNIDSVNKAIKNCRKSFFIADIHDKIPETDVVINHLPWANKNNYKSKNKTKFFLGTEYAIIRNEFYKKPVISNGRVFICLGNSENIQKTILKIYDSLILNGYNPEMIDIVYKDKINSIGSNVFNRISAQKMFSLMVMSELCIITPGNISYEVFKVGRNCVIGCLNEGQIKVARKFEKLNLCNYVGLWDNFERLDLDSISKNSGKIISTQNQFFKENSLKKIKSEIWI